ncbi:MAG: K(+)-transporting ATPase subunit C [Acidobacteria bacterium]|nr:K(+)-transporting ATPase subunit C [Acidobacteriota bacterium]MBV9475382.1 K(+)-transporting ATPase subunit C [Acidobacteriota bacterium]
MKEHLVIATRTTLVLLVLVSGIYPAIVWGIGQLAFRDAANGSLIVRDGRVVGSSLIAQPFTSARYFHPRPSAVDYNAQGSGGSNLGPTSQKLRDRIVADVRALQTTTRATNIPPDAVTTSASGLDPHISPEYALLQVPRVARARHLDEANLRALVRGHTEGRFLGVYGEPRVNVLQLNLALDALVSRDGARE